MKIDSDFINYIDFYFKNYNKYICSYSNLNGLYNLQPIENIDEIDYIFYTINENNSYFINNIYMDYIKSLGELSISNGNWFKLKHSTNYLKNIFKNYENIDFAKVIKDEYGKYNYVEYNNLNKILKKIIYEITSIAIEIYEENYAKEHNFIEKENKLFYEFATFKKKRSNLSVDIWLDDNRIYRNSGHYNRIKFSPDYQESNTKKFIPMIIDRLNPYIPKNLKSKCKLKNEDIEELKNFIRKNYNGLMRLANDNDYDFQDFLIDFQKEV